MEIDATCGLCDHCWFADIVPDGLYDVGITFYEYCDPSQCDPPDELEEHVAQIEYPGDEMVIEVGP